MIYLNPLFHLIAALAEICTMPLYRHPHRGGLTVEEMKRLGFQRKLYRDGIYAQDDAASDPRMTITKDGYPLDHSTLRSSEPE